MGHGHWNCKSSKTSTIGGPPYKTLAPSYPSVLLPTKNPGRGGARLPPFPHIYSRLSSSTFFMPPIWFLLRTISDSYYSSLIRCIESKIYSCWVSILYDLYVLRLIYGFLFLLNFFSLSYLFLKFCVVPVLVISVSKRSVCCAQFGCCAVPDIMAQINNYCWEDYRYYGVRTFLWDRLEWNVNFSLIH